MTDMLPPQPALIWNPNTLAWQIAPTHNPPPPIPPAGLGSADEPVWGAPKTWPPATHAAAIINIIAGAGMFLSVFLPAFAITDVYGNAMWYPMTQTPDAPWFMICGLILAALGAARVYKDDIGVCVLVAVFGVAGLIFAVTDAGLSHQAFLSKVGTSGYGYTFGAALFLIGATGVVATVSCFMPKPDPR
jgi:hypothetical protein